MSWAMVTGASSGIGKAFCRELAVRGHNLVLVARRVDCLKVLAEELAQYYGVHSEILVADLAEEVEVQKVADRIRADLCPISLLINNAGFPVANDFLDGNYRREEQALAVMVKAVMELSQAAATKMVARGRGGIINLSSVAADMYMGRYSAHKAWVDHFTQALSQEVKSAGVLVLSLKPGTTRTAFFNAAGFSLEGMPNWLSMSAEQVAVEALDALAKGYSVWVPGRLFRLASFLMRHTPQGILRQIDGTWGKARI